MAHVFVKTKSLSLLVVVSVATSFLATSCFTPRGSLDDMPLEGALGAGYSTPYEPIVGTVGFGEVPTVAENEKEAYDLATRYLRAIGTDLTFDATIEDIMNVFRQDLPKVPQEFFTEFKQKMDVSRARDQVVRAVMALHSKEDLRGIVAFFESAPGKSYLENRSPFTQDMARIGAEFTRQVNARLILELKRRSFMY